MVPIVRQYAESQGWATAAQLAAGYGHIPARVLPLSYAMMYGATLGGNGTMFGASSNIVAAGICVREGRPLRYVEFARYGIPVMVVQLIVSAIYLKLRFLR
jgi:Na+/H+ antiporter NhaD/arsenite permease-like protein